MSPVASLLFFQQWKRSAHRLHFNKGNGKGVVDKKQLLDLVCFSKYLYSRKVHRDRPLSNADAAMN